MASLDENWLNELVNKITKRRAFDSITFQCQPNNKQIENYFGVLTPLKIIGHKKNSTQTIINVLLKSKPKILEERMKSVLKYLFETEYYVYTSLIPTFNTIFIGDFEGIFPKCYYADLAPVKEVIVLQDLNYEGFKRYNHRFLDYDHVVISIKSLAKFHSMSILLQKQHFEDILKPYTDTYPVELNKALKSSLVNYKKFFEEDKYIFLNSLNKRFSDIRKNTHKKVKCLVYGHGDFWKENILFKYNQDKPTQACILDFQMVQPLSQAQDFLYFLITSTDSKTRKYFEQFISIYLQTVSETAGNKETSAFKEDFQYDLRMIAENCIIISFMAFSLWYGLEEETLIKSKDTSNRKKAEAEFVQTMNDVLDDLNGFGLIQL